MSKSQYSVGSIKRGVVVECDETIKTYIQHLSVNKKPPFGREFILEDLGPVGVLVPKDCEADLKKAVTDMLDSNEYKDKDKEAEKSNNR